MSRHIVHNLIYLTVHQLHLLDCVVGRSIHRRLPPDLSAQISVQCHSQMRQSDSLGCLGLAHDARLHVRGNFNQA